MSAREHLRRFVSVFDLRSTSKWLLLAALVGVVAGIGAVVFSFGGELCSHGFLGLGAGYHPTEAAGEHAWLARGTGDLRIWALLGVLIVGGLVSGFIVYTFAPEAEGHGTDAAIEAFHERDGEIRPRIPLVKLVASAVTIGSGGSGGREGPIAQIGAGFGSFLGGVLRLSRRDRRLMVAIGMGAGVGAIFRAPLAGALFAGEILYREGEFETDAIIPGAFASIVSYCVYCLFLPPELRFTPLFGKGLDFQIGSLAELLPLGVFAIVLVAVGVLYIKTFYGVHRLFARLPVKKHFRPAIGAGLAGLLAIGLYYAFGRDERVLAVLSAGYGAIQGAFEPSDGVTSASIGVLLAIAFGKILTTSLTISSGGSGGVFGPSMVIGATIGAAVGRTFHALWPSLTASPQVYVIIGMAGFFAGIAHAPFSTIVMVSEMTGDYELLLPAMWVSTLTFILCRRWTLYTKQVPTRLDSPAHKGDLIVDVLAGLHVRDVYRCGTEHLRLIHEGMTLNEIVHLLPESRQEYFPVVDADGRMVGIFSATDVRGHLYVDHVWEVAVARDIMVSEFLSVVPDDDLNRALRRFTQSNIEVLPVMDPDEPGRLLGVLGRRETIAAYNQRLDELQGN